jgi:hypothetical protein
MTVRLDIARAYLKALEENRSPRPYLHDAIEQVEYPNRLNPAGQRSSLAQMEARAARGAGMVRWQRYDVAAAHESGDTVILEVDWSAAFNLPVGSLQPGETMKARFAVFLDFEGDVIRRQRNYDCFEAF